MMSIPSGQPQDRARDRIDPVELSGAPPGSEYTRHRAGVSRRGLTRLALLLLGAYVALTAVWAALGLLITGPLSDTWVGALDHGVTGSLVVRRTPPLNELTQIGSMLSQTVVKVGVTVVCAVVVFIAWRSARDVLLICCATILEAAVFITVTWLVHRPRPDVESLEKVSVGTSFPSGHAAAAAAYAAIAIVVFERTRRVWIRAVVVVLAVLVPLVVGFSRIYRGAHYLTDVLAGIVLGAVCVLVTYWVVRQCLDHSGDGSRLTGRQAREQARR